MHGDVSLTSLLGPNTSTRLWSGALPTYCYELSHHSGTSRGPANRFSWRWPGELPEWQAKAVLGAKGPESSGPCPLGSSSPRLGPMMVDVDFVEVSPSGG
eukprot:3574925-Alexandrium_andersonii.AAC.1